MDIAPGSIIGGKYRLERPLSRGGMGSVWAARHVHLGSPVAIKFMDPTYAGSPAFVARFEREARIAANLESPHIVHVGDYGVDEGTPYLVMALLRGEDLSTRLERVGPLPLPEAVRILAQAGKAVRRAHEAGLVHRDLKPGNLFLARVDDEEIVKVLDFGIVKETGSQVSGEVTATGEVLGSPHYMSPEQVRGDRDVDHRSDLWSLGVILFRVLTGQPPFPGDKLGTVLSRILVDPLPRATQIAPHLPPAIDGFFARALARDREQRFQSVREMLDELQRVAGLPGRDASMPDTYFARPEPRPEPKTSMAQGSSLGGTMPLSVAAGTGPGSPEPSSAAGTLTSAGVAAEGSGRRISKGRTPLLLALALGIGAVSLLVGVGVSLRVLRGGDDGQDPAGAEAAPAEPTEAQETAPAEPAAPLEQPAVPPSAHEPPASVAPTVVAVAPLAPSHAASTAPAAPATTTTTTTKVTGTPPPPSASTPRPTAPPATPAAPTTKTPARSKGKWF